METVTISHGSRIAYFKDGHKMLSKWIYSNGVDSVRIIIDTLEMTYVFIEPISGQIVLKSTKKITNLEVLQRNVKKDLCNYLKIFFDKEVRKK